jgi:hypothetical protein
MAAKLSDLATGFRAEILCPDLRSTVQPTTPYTIRYSLLLLGYKPVQHGTVLNTVGNCNTLVSIVILCYDIMGPP